MTHRALTALGLLALATPAFAQDELNALVWCDHTDPALIAPFEAKYGVKVNLKEYEGTAAGLAILDQSQPGDWDVLVIDAVDVPRAVAAGKLAFKVGQPTAFDGKQLRVKATFYTRQAALSEFDLAAARVVDLREHTEFKPSLKTNGFAVPGLQAGHFRLRDKRAAFLLVTDPARVLCLPHTDGRVWMLSLTHPQAVLDILRRATA